MDQPVFDTFNLEGEEQGAISVAVIAENTLFTASLQAPMVVQMGTAL
jgi:hypothetical protein